VTFSLMGAPAEFWGRVAHAQPGVGFALRFEHLDQELRERLQRFLSIHP
jgi:hypothetical protein